MVNTVRFGTVVLSAVNNPDCVSRRGEIKIHRDRTDEPDNLVKIFIPNKGELPLGTSPTARELHVNARKLIQPCSAVPGVQEPLREKLRTLLGENSNIDTSTGDPQAVAYFQTMKKQLFRCLTEPKQLGMSIYGYDDELFEVTGTIQPKRTEVGQDKVILDYSA